ncbi:MAG: NAD(P)H:quinone oxidoreductase [Sphingomonadales bacterium]|nr:NAD(P)H:quinone oxidoreductase [Sphingomonadales bacterium]MDE2568439.1 NAD(P)H:quinone oxidoreductase [Sphingomonadales bacterium]
MANVLVVFYSRDGVTEALANAMAQGAMAAGATVRIRRAREVVGEDVMAFVPGWADSAARMNQLYEAPTADDAQWADAIVLGSPSRFGLVCSEVKAWLDGLGALWARGKLAGKVGSAFASSNSMHGGNEMTNFTLTVPMAHFGMVIVPPGFADPAMFRAGTPYGASAVTQMKPGYQISQEERDAARFQGRRVAEVARKLNA